MNNLIEVRLGTDDLKFAAAHMTLFPDGTKEPIHGHTYHVIVSLYFKNHSFEKMVPFFELKKSIRKLCEQWHHKLLLPALARDLKIIKQEEETEFYLCKKHYLIPSDEIEMIPTDNTSTEVLAEEFARRLLKESVLQQVTNYLEKLEVHIEQRPRQGASVILTEFS